MSRRASALMFQGTGSGVGKSLAVCAMCRILWRMGVRVAPFKAQNMALNSFDTANGLEMGRAQVYQAEACGLEPDVRMNPILLKPTGDSCSQVIALGRPVGNYSSKGYYDGFERHLKVVREAYDSLSKEFDIILIEGAGSPAEINLQARDLVNMRMAEYAQAPVLLIGDIDKGGVFAWLKGTLDLLSQHHRQMVAGLLINKFRGDKRLLEPGLEQFSRMTGLPFLGVLPYFSDISVDEEDGMFSLNYSSGPREAAVHLAVVRLPRISNFTDVAPFLVEQDVAVEILQDPRRLKVCDCIIIPGSKNTRADMEFLRRSGWQDRILALAREGGVVVGICGGYQMLGREIDDTAGVEGPPGKEEGLGLLPVRTAMKGEKKLTRTTVSLHAPPIFETPLEANGYEIHMGETEALGEVAACGPDLGAGFGALSVDGTVFGTYLHGIFDNDHVRRSFIDFIRKRKGLEPLGRISSYREFRELNLDRLASWFESNTDIDAILSLVGL